MRSNYLSQVNNVNIAAHKPLLHHQKQTGYIMPKGYFLSAHRSPADPDKRQAYLELAGPAIVKAGGKLLATTNAVEAHENGVSEQTVLIEFESLEKAKAAYQSADYQAALDALDGGADRDVRIFEGV
jgi:uncharacterized protein (DUF1330 family)